MLPLTIYVGLQSINFNLEGAQERQFPSTEDSNFSFCWQRYFVGKMIANILSSHSGPSTVLLLSQLASSQIQYTALFLS
jgi:hypothetical protein